MNAQNTNNVFVFDMDNTLIKTDKANNLAYSEAINLVLGVKYGIDHSERFTRDKLKTVFPNLTETQFREIVAHKEQCFVSYIKETELNHNLFILLKSLHYEGCHTILLTNSRSERAINLCNYYDSRNILFGVSFMRIVLTTNTHFLNLWDTTYRT